jgi:hypothetical protein
MALFTNSLIGKILLPFYRYSLESKAELSADLPPVKILMGAPVRLLLCLSLNAKATYLERYSLEKTYSSLIRLLGS